MKNYKVKNRPFLLLAVILFCSAIPSVATGQSVAGDNLTGQLRPYKYDVRTSALGDATVADPAYASSMNSNPASIALAENFNSVQINLFHNWNNNLAWESIAYPIFRNAGHAFAGQLGYHHAGFEKMNMLGENPYTQPELDAFQADLAYAWTYREVFSLGIMGNLSFTQNEHSRYWSSFVNLGLMYAPSRSVSYGATLKGLGRTPAYTILDDGRTGIRPDDLPATLELGATLHFPVRAEKTGFSVSMANEKIFGEKGIWYKGGVEARPVPALALRTGLLFHLKDSDSDDDHILAPRFGIGFLAGFATIDYSFSPSDQLYERFHQIGVTFDF